MSSVYKTGPIAAQSNARAASCSVRIPHVDIFRGEEHQLQDRPSARAHGVGKSVLDRRLNNVSRCKRAKQKTARWRSEIFSICDLPLDIFLITLIARRRVNIVTIPDLTFGFLFPGFGEDEDELFDTLRP